MSKKPKKAKTPKAPKVKGGKKTVDNITGQWAEEGFFITGTGVDEDGPYEDEGPLGYLRSDRLPNGRFIFDQASYNPADYSKERWILFDDVNINKEFDSADKIWGYLRLSKTALKIKNSGLDPLGDDSSDFAGIWEAEISAGKSIGKLFHQGFHPGHLGDIQIMDATIFL